MKIHLLIMLAIFGQLYRAQEVFTIRILFTCEHDQEMPTFKMCPLSVNPLRCNSHTFYHSP